MSTTMPNTNSIVRKWYVIDAAGRPMGKVAVEAANLLRGKNKVTFAPHADCGDNVIIINCEKTVLTGNKLTQKFERHHTGWIGHLKETRYDTLMATNPEKAMRMAVEGMLPKNSLGRTCATRLRVYKGENHEQTAQKPEVWAF